LGWYFYNVLGWWREINIVAYLEGMEISTEILRHLCFQVFRHCNRNSWWLPGPFPSILHSSYCPPTCSWTKAPADYFGRCKLSKCCIINISLWNPKLLTHFNKKISTPPPPSFLFFFQVALTLNTAAGAAAAAIVYLAHNGNSNTNWLAICQQYGDFCQKVSGAVVASFITVVIFVFLIVLSAFALRRH